MREIAGAFLSVPTQKRITTPANTQSRRDIGSDYYRRRSMAVSDRYIIYVFRHPVLFVITTLLCSNAAVLLVSDTVLSRRVLPGIGIVLWCILCAIGCVFTCAIPVVQIGLQQEFQRTERVRTERNLRYKSDQEQRRRESEKKRA